jgi:beta-glucosidase/6-phospho-beta-glucosidase/beta-galactosidase
MDRFVARMTNAAFNDAFIKMVADGEIPFANKLLNRSLDGLKGSWDFVPISVYGKFGVAHDPWGFKSSFMRRITPIGPGVRSGDVAPNGEDLYGQLYPEGIRDVVERFAHLKKPYFMLESGCQDRDDKVRPWVLVKGAKVVHDLIREGYTIHGYHHWTLVDNFEWKFGWSLRFGLIELDVETQERRPRRSSELFREIATNNALSGRMVREYVPDAYEEIFG